jgi:hypothetical protein
MKSDLKKIIEQYKDKEYFVEDENLKFVPAKPVPPEQIKKFEAKIGQTLPLDFVQFLTTYGAADYFGANILPLNKIPAVFRYDEKTVSAKSIPSLSVILFTQVGFFLKYKRNFGFAFVASADLKKTTTLKYRVYAWTGAASDGMKVEDQKWNSFTEWLSAWPKILEEKVKYRESNN